MSTFRSATAPALLLLGLVVAACASPVPQPAVPQPDPPAPGIPARPQPTLPATGDVEGETPLLTVERTLEGRLRIAITDPAAKAWRITALSGDLRDRWELDVVTSDVDPIITIREIRSGEIVAEEDLSPFAGDPTASTGGCHPTLGLCWASNDLELPHDGLGELAVSVDLIAPPPGMLVVGSSASWDGEPFSLGPWRSTEALLITD